MNFWSQLNSNGHHNYLANKTMVTYNSVKLTDTKQKFGMVVAEHHFQHYITRFCANYFLYEGWPKLLIISWNRLTFKVSDKVQSDSKTVCVCKLGQTTIWISAGKRAFGLQTINQSRDILQGFYKALKDSFFSLHISQRHYQSLNHPLSESTVIKGALSSHYPFTTWFAACGELNQVFTVEEVGTRGEVRVKINNIPNF